MGIVCLSSDSEEKNTLEVLEYSGLRRTAKFLTELNQKVEKILDVEEFKEELCDIKKEIGEPILMGTELNKEMREELF